jgi:hypothetical protein
MKAELRALAIREGRSLAGQILYMLRSMLEKENPANE